MAAKKKLNTNLVAFLTVMGMILTVAVVTIITVANTNRDPEVYAEEARRLEAAGDYDRAARKFLQAFNVNRENAYRIEAARVLFEGGDIGSSIGTLRQANADTPQDPNVVEAIIEKLWVLHDVGQFDPTSMRDFGEKLLALDEDSVLGLLTHAQGLLELKEDADVVAEHLARAEELAPANPRLVMAKVSQLRTPDALAELVNTTTPKLLRDVPLQREALRLAQEQAIALYERGLAENPDSTLLITNFVSLLMTGAEEFRDPARARQLLSDALERMPDDVVLQLSYGGALLQQVLAESETLDDAGRDALIDRALEHVDRALALEPAEFRAYSERARAVMLRTDPSADPQADQVRRVRETVEMYARAMDETSTLSTLQAVINAGYRAQMLFDGFDQAMVLRAVATNDAAKKEALEHAREFMEASTIKYPEHGTTMLMTGVYAAATDDQNTAINAFMKLATRTADSPNRQLLAMHAEATQRLALLYHERRQPGEAERYADEAIETYTLLGRTPPRALQTLKLAYLVDRGEAEEALDSAEVMLRTYPDDPQLLQVKAAALASLGRTTEANELLAGAESAGGLSHVIRAEMAVAANDLESAESLLRAAVERDPADARTMRMLTQVMVAADRRDELVTFLEGLAESATDEAVQRQVRGYLAVVTEEDPATRDQQLIDLIMENPDEQARLSDLYIFHYSRRNFEQARRVLDDLEAILAKAGPDQRNALARTLEQQFTLALQTSDHDRAEQYAARLAELNVDGANGARYRGLIALSEGDGEAAVAELSVVERETAPDASVKTLLAQAYLSCEPPRQSEAMSLVEDAVRMKRDHSAANRLLFLLKDRAGFASDEERRELLMRAYQLNRNDQQLRARAEAEMELLNPTRAIAQREQLREDNPDNLENLTRLARLYAQPTVNDVEKAAATLEAASQVADAADLTDTATERLVRELYRTGLAFYAAQGDRAGGEALITPYLDRCTGMARITAELLLANFYERLGEFEASDAAYSNAAALVPNVLADQDLRESARAEIALHRFNYLARAKRWDDLLAACQERIDQLDPADKAQRDRLRMRMIDTYLQAARTDEALPLVQAQIAEQPDDYLGYAALARLELLRGSPVPAKEALDRALQLQPDQAWCLFSRGSINLDLRYMREAAEDLTRAKRVAPDEFDMQHRMRLARLYIETERPSLAETEFLEIVDDENSSEGAVEQATQELLKLYRHENQTAKAEDMISRYAAQQPDNAFWPYQLGLLRIENRDFNRAVRPLGQAAALTDYEDQVIIADWMRGMLLADRPQDVLIAEERVPVDKQTPLVRVVIARANHILGDQAEAERKAREALAAGAQLGMRTLGTIWRQVNNFYSDDELEALIEELLQMSLNDNVVQARLRSVLGELQYRQRRFDEAEATLRQAYDETPPMTVERGFVLLALAQVEGQRGDRYGDKVKSLYEQVLELDPHNLTALNNLAYLLTKRGEPEQALPLAQHLRTLQDENANTWDTIGTVYMQNKRIDEARSALHRALTLDLDNADANLHLGQLLAGEGEAGDARRYLERAREVAEETGRSDVIEQAQATLDSLR